MRKPVKITRADAEWISAILQSNVQSTLYGHVGDDESPKETVDRWKKQRRGYIAKQCRHFPHCRRSEHVGMRNGIDYDAAILTRIAKALAA